MHNVTIEIKGDDHYVKQIKAKLESLLDSEQFVDQNFEDIEELTYTTTIDKADHKELQVVILEIDEE